MLAKLIEVQPPRRGGDHECDHMRDRPCRLCPARAYSRAAIQPALKTQWILSRRTAALSREPTPLRKTSAPIPIGRADERRSIASST
jgi:hypothetical protein